MDSAAQHDTVWVGFMDVVPVIGTVKEGVEWAMALYEENTEVVKEKEEAIKKLLLAPALLLKPKSLAEPESLVAPMKGLRLPETPEGRTEDPKGGTEDPKGAAASTSASALGSALQDVKEVKLEELVEYVRSLTASKKKTLSHKPGEEEETEKVKKKETEKVKKKETEKVKKEETEKVKKEETKKVKKKETEKVKEETEKVKKKETKKVKKKETEKVKEETEKVKKIEYEMLKKIRFLIPKYSLSTGLKRETQRSRRGEHVFNNGILKFHDKLLKALLEIMDRSDRGLSDILHRGCNTLKPHTQCEIKNNMVVTFDKTDFYVNANSILYGVYCQELRSALLQVLCFPDLHNLHEEQRVNKIIELMNVHEIYVDQMAKAKWIDNEERKRRRFNEVKYEVANMYRKKGYKWCISICYWLDHDF